MEGIIIRYEAAIVARTICRMDAARPPPVRPEQAPADLSGSQSQFIDREMYTIIACAPNLMRRVGIGLFCVVFAWGLAACQTTTIGTDEAVRFFNDVAFRGSPGGYPMSGSVLLGPAFSKSPLVRWESPLIVQIKGQPTAAYKAQVARILADFNRLTGVAYAWADETGGDPNFVVDFEPDKGFLINNVEYVPCYANSDIRNGRIRRVAIKISLQKPHLVPHCISHELAHGFGFAHSNVLPSVVSPNQRLESFSRWDEVALEALYDDRLRAGMVRAEALPIARKIISERLGGPS